MGQASSTALMRSTSSTSAEYTCGPGLCVIIHNTEFKNPKNDLPGGEQDEANLKFTFTLLGFNVKLHQNKTAAEIGSIARGYSAMKHTGAFFLIISSHGGKGDVVYGVDEKEVSVRDLEMLFHATNCPSLAGIPKVFVIDACRGGEKEKTHQFIPKASPQSFNTNTSSKRSVMDSDDVMTIFASTPGHTSGCDEDEGSYLIQKFADVLGKAYIEKNLTDLMKEVHREIQKLEVQTPQVNSTLSKDYYITRGTKLEEYLKLDKKSEEDIEKWLSVRKRTIRETKEIVEKLEEHYRNIKISKGVGAAAIVGGSITAFVGGILTPLTFGAGIPVLGAGLGIAGAGVATVAGSKGVEILIKSLKLNEFQEKYDEDQRQLKDIEEIIEKMKAIVTMVYEKYPEIEENVIEFVYVLANFFTGTAHIRIDQLVLSIAELRVGVEAAKKGIKPAKKRRIERVITTKKLDSHLAAAENASFNFLDQEVQHTYTHCTGRGLHVNAVAVAGISFSSPNAIVKAIVKLKRHIIELEEQMESVKKLIEKKCK